MKQFWFMAMGLVLGMIVTWSYFTEDHPESQPEQITYLKTQTIPVQQSIQSHDEPKPSKQILTSLIEKYPSLTATQAADLSFRIDGSPTRFDFGSNHGAGMVENSNNPVTIAYQNYVSSKILSSPSTNNPAHTIPNQTIPDQNPISISFSYLASIIKNMNKI